MLARAVVKGLINAKDIEKNLNFQDQKQTLCILKLDCISYHCKTFKQKSFPCNLMYIKEGNCCNLSASVA